MKSLLIATLCCLSCAAVKAQTQAIGTVLGNQRVIPIATNAPGYAIDAQALIYYPDDYFLPANASKRYPLFMFLHGAGEGSSSNIAEVLNTSLPALIAQGLKPYGIDTLTGDTIKFIVVSPHCAGCGGSYSYPQLQYTIPYLVANYRIDSTCMWAGGLSSGGRATFSLPMGNVVGDTLLGNKLAGIMPMANGGYDNRTDLFPNLATAMKSGLTVLYTIGDQDPGYNATGFFQYDALMSKNAQPGKYYPKVIVGGTHSTNVWNPPFYLTSRLWNVKYNAWTQMGNTHRVFTGGKPAPLSDNAGIDQAITLPVSSVTLSGSATPGSGTTISSWGWTLVSGPNTPTIGAAAAASTTVSGLIAGTYTFRLTVASSAGTKATDDVVVVVNAAVVNKAPVSNAGIDQSITLPVSTVTLSGTGTDADGTISAYTWAKVSGSTGTITNAAAASTTVTGLAQGTYLFSLTVTDNSGARTSDTLQVIVNAAVVNKAPVSNAGIDQSITLPVSTVTLSGTGTDADGTISAYAWAKVSGSTGTITNAAAASTTVTGLVQGTYLFSLTVTDNSGARTSDTMTVTVNAVQLPNQGSGSTPAVVQSVIPIPVNAPGYAQSQALVYYPDDYFAAANASKKYALFIFLHAEAQGVSSDINELTNASLPQLIQQGLKPYGIDSLTGDTVKFIIVSPHAANSYGSYSYMQLRYTIPYLLTSLRVDTNCVWLGGPSMGGRGTFSVPMEDTVLGKKLTGIMPMSDGGYDTRYDLIPNLNTCLKRGMGYIYTVGAMDVGVLTNSRYYIDTMRKAVTAGRGFYKEIAGLGHTADAWTQPFLLGSRWWNANKNAWDIMANTRRNAKIGAAAAQVLAQRATAVLATDAGTTAAPVFTLYPNPVKDVFVMGLNNPYTGKLLVQIIDGSGAVRRIYSYSKDQAVMQVNVQVSDLPAGTYFVRVQVGMYHEVKKLIKL